jgi:FKBP-type peptidyl-prolyl cis-trans isomerase
MMRPILWSITLCSLCFSQSTVLANTAENINKTNSSTIQNTSPGSTIVPNAVTLGDKNAASSKAFLEENKRKPEIHTLTSGLQYKILTEGTGPSPGPTDFVTVNYRGTLIEGTEFDSSYSRPTPSTFAVNAVIPGWSEALQLMKQGSKWTIYVPPNLAYGERGAGRLIGPNAALIFEIELIAVKPVLDENSGATLGDMDEEG